MTRILKYSIIPYILVLILSITFLFTVKYKVQNLAREIKTLNKQIVTEKQNLHVLKAEYTYLSNPKRIKSLADVHLKLKPVKSTQVIRSPKELEIKG